MPRRPPKPPLSFHTIQTHCHSCNYSLRGPRYTKCPECGAAAWRELSEDDTRPLTDDESAFLRSQRPNNMIREDMGGCIPPLGLLLAIPVFLLARSYGLSLLDTAAVMAILVLPLAGIFIIVNHRARRSIRANLESLDHDLANAIAATTYLDIQQSILVRGGWYGSQIKMLFLRHRDTLVAEFNLDTIKDLFPDIATRTPARIAIDFLPNTGIILTARPVTQETIPTELREIKMFDDHWGAFIYGIDELDEFTLLNEGDPSLFPSHSDDEQPES